MSFSPQRPGATATASTTPMGPPSGRRGQLDPASAGFWRDDILYAGDPQFALQNALMAEGFNPRAANPFMRRIMQSASGLALAAQMQNMGMGADQVAAAGGEGGITGQFLRNVLGSGSIIGTLQNASQRLNGGMGGELSAYLQNSLNGGQVNPFAEQLAETLGTARGMGGAMSALMAPQLGGSLGQAYGTGLGYSLGGASRQQAADADPNRDFWSYVLGG